jgi:hypothetical protein
MTAYRASHPHDREGRHIARRHRRGAQEVARVHEDELAQAGQTNRLWPTMSGRRSRALRDTGAQAELLGAAD